MGTYFKVFLVQVVHEVGVALGRQEGGVGHVLALLKQEVHLHGGEVSRGVVDRAQRALQTHVLLGDHHLLVGHETPPDGATLLLGHRVIEPRDEHPDEGRVQFQLVDDAHFKGAEFISETKGVFLFLLG